MKKQTKDSKTKKDEVISDENTELTDEALEQVNGGDFELTKETQSVSRSAQGKIALANYNFTTPTTGHK